nr:uncharacterized protein LOC113818723 [Penaeus vannamei]
MPYRGFSTGHLDLLTWLPVAVIVGLLMVMALSCWAAKHALLWKRRAEEATAIAGGKCAYVEADGGRIFATDVKQASAIEVPASRASGFEISPNRPPALDFVSPNRPSTLNIPPQPAPSTSIPPHQHQTINIPPARHHKTSSIDTPSGNPKTFKKHQGTASRESKCNIAFKISVVGEEFQMCSLCGNVKRCKGHVYPPGQHTDYPVLHGCSSFSDVTVSAMGHV